MTPRCEDCQIDFRPGEEADMEAWERDGVPRCRACAEEFAALHAFMATEDFWRALDDAMAHPLFVQMDTRTPLYPPPGHRIPMLLTSTPTRREPHFATIHSRSRPHG